MRTNPESRCTDSAHFWVHFPAMFGTDQHDCAGTAQRNGNKMPLFVIYLLRHLTRCIPRLGPVLFQFRPFFYFAINDLHGLSDSRYASLHRFCTLFANRSRGAVA